MVEVVHFDGLLVDLYRREGACAVVRGLRSESDFRFEAEMAAANNVAAAELRTCLMPCRIRPWLSRVRRLSGKSRSYGGEYIRHGAVGV
jgi:phosphopantetheine adenylyltransferase